MRAGRYLAKIVTALTALAVIAGINPPPAAAATETNLGSPITNVALDKVAYGTSPSGAPEMYAVPLSANATAFHVIDVRTGAVRLRLPMPNASGARDLVTAPDGQVYVATFDSGRLYRYDPASATVTDLGKPSAAATHLFGLAVHPDGTVFAGEYPTGKLYGYHPSTDTFRDFGFLSSDSAYTRSIAVWKGSLLVGLGTQRAHFYGVNISTGVKYEIPLPAAYASENEINQVTVRGDLAYVRAAQSGTLLVYDIYAKTWSTAAGTSTGLDVSPISPYQTAQQEVYHVRSGQLKAFSPVTGATRNITAFTGMGTSRGFAWVNLNNADYPGQTLAMADYFGKMWFYNPQSGAAKTITAQIPGMPVDIRSVGIGPDSRIWVGGFGSGGLAAYNPSTGQSTQVPRGTVGQSEEILTVGDDLWLGTYPGANVLRYNPSEPFVWGTNPATAASLAGHQQDRPMALAAADNRIVIGTVPSYGQVSGALTVHHPATGATTVNRGISGTRSPVTFATDGNVVYAGTTKWGGLGATPPAADGTIFAYDPATNTKLWEVTPYPGLPAITELAMSPTGTVWGLTNGKLFEFDPATRSVVREIAVPAENWGSVDHVWSEFQRLAVASDGTVYAQVTGRLLRVSPGAATYTQIGWATTFVLANDSTIYLARGSELFRLDL